MIYVKHRMDHPGDSDRVSKVGTETGGATGSGVWGDGTGGGGV